MKDNNSSMDFVIRHFEEGKLDADKALSNVRRAVGKRTPVMRYIASAAAAVAVIAALFTFTLRNPVTTIIADNSTREVILPDQSKVYLSEGSEISFREKSMRKGPRVITLSGKAFFEVERDETKPFEVLTGGGFVKVLGTKFQVDANRNEVYVESGKVFVAKAENADGVILTKGMLARIFPDDAIPAVDQEASPNEIAWKRGSLIYDGTPVDIVISEIERFYDRRISVQSFGKDIKELKLSGEFDTESPQDVLASVGAAFGIEVKFN